MPLNFGYAGVLRCIGQALQKRNIDIFELKSSADEFRLQAADPNPPYIALIEMRFSTAQMEVLDREGKMHRGQANEGIRFDSIAEILRGIGGYVDSQRGQLLRIDNSRVSLSDDPVVEVEYETRTGLVQSENLTMSFLREASVNMYKRRTQPTNLVTFPARRT
jgi:hypothetical protein